MGNCASFCRPSRRDEDEFFRDLDSGVISLGQRLIADREELDACARSIGKSFAGQGNAEPEPVINWLIGPQYALQDSDGNTLPCDHHAKGSCSAERLKVVEFAMRFPLRRHGLFDPASFILGTSSKTAGLRNGIVVCRIFGEGFQEPGLLEGLQAMRVVLWDVGIAHLPRLFKDPKFKSARELFEKRGAMVDKTMESLHKKYAPEPHIYVSVVATHPDAQGQGFCSLLMRCVNEFADSTQLPCYLECGGERRISIYTRFGYKVVGNFKIEVKDDDMEGWQGVEYTAMKRLPTIAAVAEMDHI